VSSTSPNTFSVLALALASSEIHSQGRPHNVHPIYLCMFYFLSHARFARVHREIREKQPFPPIGRYRLEEKFSAPQAQKDFKPEEFAESMSLSLQSVSLRLERNFTLRGLCELCVRHLFIWLRRRRSASSAVLRWDFYFGQERGRVYVSGPIVIKY